MNFYHTLDFVYGVCYDEGVFRDLKERILFYQILETGSTGTDA